MKRSILGAYLISILRSPDAGEGGGGAGAGLSMTGDASMDTAVMGRLGLDMEAAPGEKVEGRMQNAEGGKGKGTASPAEAGPNAEQEAAAAEEKRIAEMVKSSGKTKEAILAEETAASELATQERETLIEARMAEKELSREDAEAEILAEETAAADDSVQTPELSAEAKTWVDEQLAAKDAEFTTLKQQHEEATARVTELEQQLEAGNAQPLAVAPIDPLFLIDDPAQLEAQAGELRNFEKWALENWDGVEPVEASADGKVKAHPGYTKEQIRQRYAQIKEVRETFLPEARKFMATRQAHEAQARKVYPALFDPKKPEYKVAGNLLKLAPGLKAVIPNIHIVIGDALRGERIRVAEEKARAKGKTAVAAKAAPKVPAKPGAGARTATTSTKPKTEQVVDTGKFSKLMEEGASGRNALIASLSMG